MCIRDSYTSDQHYGITRKAFRGLDKVSSRDVNAAMVQAINTLPGISLPADGGCLLYTSRCV